MVRRRRALMADITHLAEARPRASRPVLRDFLYRPQWMADHDEPLPPSYYEAVQQQAALMREEPAPAYDAGAAARTRARVLAQNLVDRPARSVSTQEALSPEDWGEAGSPQVRTQALMDLKAQASKVSQVLGLDAVRTLVEQVADDPRVLAPVREAVVALEPALLRMAMSDPRFFGDDHHPARRLIEGVAQRSFRYNDEYAEDFQQFMAPVRQAVRQLNAQPEAHAEDFASQLASFDGDWRRQDEQDKAEHEQGLRSMQFAQQRQALADKIAWEFSLRSDLDGVPAAVIDFLFQDWSLVISHAQLTAERSQLDPGGYLAVVTDLLWSVRRDALNAPARLFDVVPGIVMTLRRGLQMLGKEPEDTESFFDTLMRLHAPVLRLRRLRSARDAEASGFGQLEDEAEPLSMDAAGEPLERPKPRAASEPWLGRQELAAAGFDEVGRDEPSAETLQPNTGSPGSNKAGPGPRGQGPGAGSPPTPPASPVAEPAASAALQMQPEELRARNQLTSLRTGDWVDLQVRGDWRRARLHWSSDNGALFMFISHGGRPHSMTRRTCEKLLRQRHLRPVEAGAVVDKALRGLAHAALDAKRGPLG